MRLDLPALLNAAVVDQGLFEVSWFWVLSPWGLAVAGAVQ
jgi:hypothetical protein